MTLGPQTQGLLDTPTKPVSEDLGQAESSRKAGEGWRHGRAYGTHTHAHPH